MIDPPARFVNLSILWFRYILIVMKPKTAKPEKHSGGDANLSPVTLAIEAAILSIPRGKVSTYGRVARAAGFPNGARQVVRVLHSRSVVAALPWHRVLGQGRLPDTARISLSLDGFDEQFALLRAEGVTVSADGMVDLSVYGFYR